MVFSFAAPVIKQNFKGDFIIALVFLNQDPLCIFLYRPPFPQVSPDYQVMVCGFLPKFQGIHQP